MDNMLIIHTQPSVSTLGRGDGDGWEMIVLFFYIEMHK